MNLSELFATRTCIRLVDALLAHPERTYMQSILLRELGVAPATFRRALRDLARLSVVHVDARFGMKVVSLNGENELAEALLDFYRRLQRVSSVSGASDTLAQSQ